MKPLAYLSPIIMHRGASYLAPENTCIAVKKGADLGADWVEFDVQLSKDEQAVIFHDQDMTRTSNGQGVIEALTFAELIALDAGSWFADEYAGEKIPSFVDLLSTIRHGNLCANVEIKIHDQDPIRSAEVTMADLKAHWHDWQRPPLISSSNFASLYRVRELDRNIPIGILLPDEDEGAFANCDWQQVASDLDCVSIHLADIALHLALIPEIKKLAYQILVHTVDDKAHAQALYKQGVDSIFTNRPEIFI